MRVHHSVLWPGPHRNASIFPSKDKKNQPDHIISSKIYSKALKAAYNNLKENNPDFHMQGWWTMESWEMPHHR